MLIRDTFSAFNNYVATTKEVQPLRNNPLNKVLFVATDAKASLNKYSGSLSQSEITSTVNPTKVRDAVKKFLSQRDTGGNLILPEVFYTGGIDVDGSNPKEELEILVKQVCVDHKEQACVIVFDDAKTTLAQVGFVEGMDPILKSWDSFMFLTVDTTAEIRSAVEKCSQLLLIKSYETSSGETWEKHADAALAGRVVTMGAGKVDGVAKELYGITSDKISFHDGDGGSLTVSNSKTWEGKNVNLYVQTVDMRDETSGMKLINGKEFINAWEINKVKLDLRNDITQFRHKQERLGVSPLDAKKVRGVITDRLNKLSVNMEDPELNPNGILVAYVVKEIPLDRTLEDNKTKFQFSITISLRGIADKFQLGITAYTDGRINLEEV